MLMNNCLLLKCRWQIQEKIYFLNKFTSSFFRLGMNIYMYTCIYVSDGHARQCSNVYVPSTHQWRVYTFSRLRSINLKRRKQQTVERSSKKTDPQEMFDQVLFKKPTITDERAGDVTSGWPISKVLHTPIENSNSKSETESLDVKKV